MSNISETEKMLLALNHYKLFLREGILVLSRNPHLVKIKEEKELLEELNFVVDTISSLEKKAKALQSFNTFQKWEDEER